MSFYTLNAEAATWTVCASGCDYTSISGAISNGNTADGDTISVSGGPYAEQIDFGGRNITVKAPAPVTLQGSGGNVPVVVFSNAETSTAVLDGFTIDNSAAANSLTRGIYIAGNAAPTIKNCTVVGNKVTTTSVDGAGIYINGGTATIIDTTIGGDAVNTNNSRHGAGLYATALSGPLSISGGAFTQNASAQMGGGLYITAPGQTVTISNVTLSNNSAANGHGGAIYLNTAGQLTTISNSTFANNTASQYGGAIYSTGSPLTITGGSINSNTATTYGGGISLNAAGANLTLSGTTLKGNSGTNGGAISAMTTDAITIIGATIGGPGGGEPNTSTTGSGGGIYMLNTTGASSVINTTIDNNTAQQYGGGIYFSSTATTSLALINSNITNNTANTLDGGGLYLAGANVSLVMTGGSISGNTNLAASRNGGGIFSSAVGGLTISRATINSNSTTNQGGGIYMTTAGATLSLSDSYIQGNSCQGGGAGILIAGSTTATITNCLISGNRLHTTDWRYGGGIFNGGTLNLYNSTIASNYAYRDGGGLYANGTETIRNSIFWGNLANLGTNDSIQLATNSIDYSCVQQASVPAGTGNINTDPQFVNMFVQSNPGTATTAGDYRLCNGAGDPDGACSSASPAIDTAGVTSAPTGDIVGAARPHDVAGKGDGVDDYDMGAYEYVPAANTAPVGGYTADNVIPAAQVVQATDGSGIVTITWKGRDAELNSVMLKTFEYSVDGGSTWNAPTYGDWSGALQTTWSDNGGARWTTATTLGAATAHSFTFNTKHADVTGLDGVDQSDVRIRFTLYDGVNSSVPVVSDNFRVDNLAPTPTLSSAVYDPATDTMVITGANITSIAPPATDVKSVIDWNKFVWDINGDNGATADITFVLGDITSLTVTNDTTLTLVFTGAKGTAIEATAGFGPLGGSDTIDVTVGFSQDEFGNGAVTDAVSDGPLSIDNMVAGSVYTDEGVTNIGAGKTVRLIVNGASAGTDVTSASGTYL
ncbi:MAG: right-handed parallel beta-helix repeat-containing protein, partial [Nitrospirota bacterium]|nr:right-handed parallel beta-helix repeat-containing protein [Nitrospirota bacterium]